jgi:small subunit ribosomal protein S18
MSERAKIRARRVTGNSQQQQVAVAKAIRVAREMALLPYSVRQVTQRSKGRRDRGDRGDRDDRPMRAEDDSAETTLSDVGEGLEEVEAVDTEVLAEASSNGAGAGTEETSTEDRAE